jgi:hypothetical protein
MKRMDRTVTVHRYSYGEIAASDLA